MKIHFRMINKHQFGVGQKSFQQSGKKWRNVEKFVVNLQLKTLPHFHELSSWRI